MNHRRQMMIRLSSASWYTEISFAPHLTGFSLRAFTWLMETSFIGRHIISSLMHANKYKEKLSETMIPDAPMFVPEFPPQGSEDTMRTIDDEDSPTFRVALALESLPKIVERIEENSNVPFRYRHIRDYAHAYRNALVTPSIVAKRLISAVEQSQSQEPPMSFLISFDAQDILKQAEASTKRIAEGAPLSILDGIFMAVKDEIDCLPYPTKGGTTWLHKVRQVKRDAICVARLRECGVIFIGKANQHELGSGVTGSNPHYRTTRNPHDPKRYTGGSSSGPAALVASGLCPATLGTDGGGSIRIPSALCGVLGVKITHGRISPKGVLELAWTVEVVAPIAATVEDAMLVYAAIVGSCPGDVMMSKPPRLNFPLLTSSVDNANALGSLKLGKYSEWFNDVFSSEVSDACNEAIQGLIKIYGMKLLEIVLPELEEMRIGHAASIGSEIASAINPYYDERRKELCYEARSTFAFFRAFSSRDYLAAQRLRRRTMHHHMEAFKIVDVILTPTTAMTAPLLNKNALSVGESNLAISDKLMQYATAPNFIGLPAITVPVGYDKDGLPIGLQLIGRPWAEATLLRLALAIEELVASSRRKPIVFYDLLKI